MYSANPLDSEDVDFDYFELPEKRVPLNVRVPTTVKAALQSMVRIWQILAKARGATQEEVDAIDVTHVASRYLRVGVTNDINRFAALAGLQGLPETEDGWTSFEKALVKGIEEEKSTKTKK